MGGDTTLPVHKNTDLAEAHNDDCTLTIELAAIENNIGHSSDEIDMTDMKNTIATIADVITHSATRPISIGHSGNEIDITDMKNTIDTQSDVIAHQVIRFASTENADVNVLSSSLFEYVSVPGLSFFECLMTDNCDAE